MRKKAQVTMKKGTIHKGVGLLVVVIGIYLFMGGGLGTANGGQGSGLSGKIVDMDPNRLMAGSPCHVMGGQAAGDCVNREIELEAWQYDWSEPTITVRSGEFVQIKATSKDVSHGIAIPQIGFNLAIQPGKTTQGGFRAPAPGEYQFGCSVMCGPGHHGHSGKLIVVA